MWVLGFAALAWVATWLLGCRAVTARIFDKRICQEFAGFAPADYTRFPEGAGTHPRPPNYFISTWSPFPFVVASRCGVNWKQTSYGSGESRVYLWLCGFVLPFEEYHTWSS